MKGGVKWIKKQFWTFVITSLVVAVIASVATVSLTGNVIKLNADKYGRYDVYTKAEIDAFNTEIDDTITRIYTMIDAKTTNQGVLDMLRDKCILTSPNGISSLGSSTTGKLTCEYYNKLYSKSTTCALVQTYVGSSARFQTCDLSIDTGIWAQVMCCSP